MESMILGKTTQKNEGKNLSNLKIICKVMIFKPIILFEKCLRYQSMVYICKTIKQNKS